jgi:CBS domain-containing protein
MQDERFLADPDKFQDPLENYEPKVYTDMLERALAEEKVIAIQYRPVATASPDTPVHEAIEELIKLHVGCLLIEEQGKLIGVFTDRDVLNKVALEYDQMKDKPVTEVMTPNPAFVYESDSSGAALSVMAVSGFRHVPVTDINQKVLGIISPQRVTTFLRKHLSS